MSLFDALLLDPYRKTDNSAWMFWPVMGEK